MYEYLYILLKKIIKKSKAFPTVVLYCTYPIVTTDQPRLIRGRSCLTTCSGTTSGTYRQIMFISKAKEMFLTRKEGQTVNKTAIERQREKKGKDTKRTES